MVSTLVIFLTILILESILSVDNAAVLAVVVNRNLSDPKDRKKAMTYGIIGAYLFRGASLFFVSLLFYNPWFGIAAKIAGGLWLFKLVYDYFWKDEDSDGEADNEVKSGLAEVVAKIFGLSIFWQTVVAVEFLDIVFSIDNILAVVSMTKNMTVIVLAVFLGILAMRFVAQYFSVLMEKFPKLEATAFVVILLLSIKLILSGFADWLPGLSWLKSIMDNHMFDFIFSGITMVIFFFPLLMPKKHTEDD